MDTIPELKGAGVFLYNNLNENLDATLITNVMDDGKFPDAISSTTTISSGQSGLLSLPIDELLVNFYSVALKCTTAPTKGYVEGFGLMKYAYRQG